MSLALVALDTVQQLQACCLLVQTQIALLMAQRQGQARVDLLRVHLIRL